MQTIHTWTHSLNVVPSSQGTLQELCRSFWLQSVAFLTTNLGWTIVSSSNGTTAGSGDNWNNSAVNINWNSVSNARSWILLKSPEGLYPGANNSYLGEQSKLYLCIDLAAVNSTTYQQCAIYLHYNAPTGGSTTAVPTSTNSLTVASSNTQYINASLYTSRFHFSGVVAGENVSGVTKGTGGFYIKISNNVNQCLTTHFAIFPLTNITKVGSVDYKYPIATRLFYNSSPSDLYRFFLESFASWNHDGTTTSSFMAHYLYNNTTSASIGYGQTNVLLDLNSTISTSPLVVYNTTSAKSCIVGNIPDVYVTAANIPAYSVDNNNSANVNFCSLFSNTTTTYWVPANTEFVVV